MTPDLRSKTVVEQLDQLRDGASPAESAILDRAKAIAALKALEIERWDDFSKDDPQSWPKYVHDWLTSRLAELQEQLHAYQLSDRIKTENIEILETTLNSVRDEMSNFLEDWGYAPDWVRPWLEIDNIRKIVKDK